MPSILTRAVPGVGAAAAALVRELEVLAPEAMVSMRIDSVTHPPWGVAGGHAAGTGRCIVNPGRPGERIIPPLSDGNIVKRGDIVRVETGGGGGWGHPFDREPERVLADVRGGFVSRDSAERELRRRADGGRHGHRSRRHRAPPREKAGGQALPPPRLSRGAGVMAKDTRARVIVGIDTGGTFTDVTLLDPATGRVWTAKTPSTPSDPSQGFGNGIAEVLKVSNLTGADIARVLHGTTVATNLILEGKGARAALITTAGFKYVLEIGRQDVPRRASLFAWVKPKRPVPPEHIFEVAGRIGPDGRELAAPRRGRRARGRARHQGARHRLHRRRSAAQLRQPGARATRRRDPRRGDPRRAAVAVERGAAGVPRVRAQHDHHPQRRGHAGRLHLRRAARRARGRARHRGAAAPDEIVGRRHQHRATCGARRWRPRSPAPRPAPSVRPTSARPAATPTSSASTSAAPRPTSR